jgi:hypothetical protein
MAKNVLGRVPRRICPPPHPPPVCPPCRNILLRACCSRHKFVSFSANDAIHKGGFDCRHRFTFISRKVQVCVLGKKRQGSEVIFISSRQTVGPPIGTGTIIGVIGSPDARKMFVWRMMCRGPERGMEGCPSDRWCVVSAREDRAWRCVKLCGGGVGLKCWSRLTRVSVHPGYCVGCCWDLYCECDTGMLRTYFLSSHCL